MYSPVSTLATPVSPNQNPSWLGSPHQKPVTGIAVSGDFSTVGWLTKPTPTPRVSTVAKTLPAPLALLRFTFSGKGGKPTGEEWTALQSLFTANPKDRIKLSTAHPDKSRENCYFLGYHKDYASGERWGTKEQLVKRRKAMRAAQKAMRQRKMEINPAYREKRLAALAAYENQCGILKTVVKEAADEEYLAKRKRLAKLYKRRAAGRSKSGRIAKEKASSK